MRSTVRGIWSLFVIGCLAAASACSSTPSAPEVEVIASGDYGGAQEASRVRLDREQAARMIERLRIDPAEVERAREAGGELVVCFAGERRTGGYSVEATIRPGDDGAYQLDCRVEPPPSDAMVTQAITTPWALVRVTGDVALHAGDSL